MPFWLCILDIIIYYIFFYLCFCNLVKWQIESLVDAIFSSLFLYRIWRNYIRYTDKRMWKMTTFPNLCYFYCHALPWEFIPCRIYSISYSNSESKSLFQFYSLIFFFFQLTWCCLSKLCVIKAFWRRKAIDEKK